MRTSSYKIAANSAIEIGASGNYVQVRLTPVDLIIENVDSNESIEVSQGDDFQFKDFNRLTIRNPSAGEIFIKLTIAKDKRAGSAKVGGSVSVAGDVNLTASTLAALESVSVQNIVSMVHGGQAYGASFRSSANETSNAAETVFTAAANVNGAIIHSMQFVSQYSAAARPCYLSKAGVPANVLDGDSILSADAIGYLNSNFTYAGSLKNPIKIPAGKGLHFISDSGVFGGSSRSVLYTLL